MSKVFLVRLSRYSIYKVQSLALSRQLAYTSTSHSLCQVLFSSFFKLFCSTLSSDFQLLGCPRGQLGYTITCFLICQAVFLLFLTFFIENYISLLFVAKTQVLIQFPNLLTVILEDARTGTGLPVPDRGHFRPN